MPPGRHVEFEEADAGFALFIQSHLFCTGLFGLTGSRGRAPARPVFCTCKLPVKKGFDYLGIHHLVGGVLDTPLPRSNMHPQR